MARSNLFILLNQYNEFTIGYMYITLAHIIRSLPPDQKFEMKIML